MNEIFTNEMIKELFLTTISLYITLDTFYLESHIIESVVIISRYLILSVKEEAYCKPHILVSFASYAN